MLFKILAGDSSRIDTETTPLHEGWAYFAADNGGFYIDATRDGAVQRIQINPDELCLVDKNGLFAGKMGEGILAGQLPVMQDNYGAYFISPEDGTYITGGTLTSPMRITKTLKDPEISTWDDIYSLFGQMGVFDQFAYDRDNGQWKHSIFMVAPAWATAALYQAFEEHLGDVDSWTNALAEI